VLGSETTNFVPVGEFCEYENLGNGDTTPKKFSKLLTYSSMILHAPRHLDLQSHMQRRENLFIF
jgi:hypothetical protein